MMKRKIYTFVYDGGLQDVHCENLQHRELCGECQICENVAKENDIMKNGSKSDKTRIILKNTLNSEKSPFLLELKHRNELQRIGKKVYSELTPLIEKLFDFCIENNHNADNELEIKEKAVFIDGDYLYFADYSGLFDLPMHDGFLFSYFRVKNKKDVFGNYIFEYCFSSESRYCKDVKYEKIDESHKKDLNFNMVFCNHVRGVLEMIFS